jgi:hypothetical protein
LFNWTKVHPGFFGLLPCATRREPKQVKPIDGRATAHHATPAAVIGDDAVADHLALLRIEPHQQPVGILRDDLLHGATPDCHFFLISGEVDHVTSPQHVGECRQRRVKPMAEPSKRVPDWLTTDILIIVVGVVVMGFVFLIAP